MVGANTELSPLHNLCVMSPEYPSTRNASGGLVPPALAEVVDRRNRRKGRDMERNTNEGWNRRRLS
jgi:hypothetical protein